MNSEDQLILDFYLGTGTDHMGRCLDAILRKDDRCLERTHDYIQSIFPIYAVGKFKSKYGLSHKTEFL